MSPKRLRLIKLIEYKLINSPYTIFCILCKLYAKITMKRDQPADPIMSLLAGMLFFILHHYIPHFKRPRSFSEKVFNRMLYSRERIWTMISDKLLVREYITRKIGNEILIPMLWNGNNPDKIPYDELPSKFVIKTNHGCKYNIFVSDKKSIDKNEINNELTEWLKENYWIDRSCGFTWAYKNINSSIVIEDFLEENGKPPIDYKFFCFAGRVEYLLITYDRHGQLSEKHYTRDFLPLDLWNGAEQYSGPFIKPQNYEEMILVSEILAKDFDFIRVDLYSVKKKIYFGELACYPAGGQVPFVPRKWDYILGNKWQVV